MELPATRLVSDMLLLGIECGGVDGAEFIAGSSPLPLPGRRLHQL